MALSPQRSFQVKEKPFPFINWTLKPSGRRKNLTANGALFTSDERPTSKRKGSKIKHQTGNEAQYLAYAKLRLFLLKNSISLHDEICSSSLSNMLSIVSFLKLLKILHQSRGGCPGPWKWVDWILAQFHKNVLKLLPNIQHVTSAEMLLFLLISSFFFFS